MTIFLITRRAKVEKHSLGSCYHLAANVKGDISLGCHPHGWQYRPQILVAKFVFGHHKEQLWNWDIHYHLSFYIWGLGKQARVFTSARQRKIVFNMRYTNRNGQPPKVSQYFNFPKSQPVNKTSDEVLVGSWTSWLIGGWLFPPVSYANDHLMFTSERFLFLL